MSSQNHIYVRLRDTSGQVKLHSLNQFVKRSVPAKVPSDNNEVRTAILHKVLEEITEAEYKQGLKEHAPKVFVAEYPDESSDVYVQPKVKDADVGKIISQLQLKDDELTEKELELEARETQVSSKEKEQRKAEKNLDAKQKELEAREKAVEEAEKKLSSQPAANGKAEEKDDDKTKSGGNK